MPMIRSVTRPVCVLAAFAVAVVHGFAPPFHTSISNIKIEHSRRRPHDARPHCARLSTTLKEKKESIPNNLLVESVAPFRGLRLFIYGSLASGAFLGGLITASGVIAALNGLRDDVDINEGYTNLAVDFGAVAFFGVLAKIELDNGAKLAVAVEEKIDRKKQQKERSGAMREREQSMKDLKVSVRVSGDGSTKVATLGTMQKNARQHIMLVAGPGRAIRDALRGAQLNKVNFAMTNILVVPYKTGVDAADRASKPDGGGFSDSRPAYETQPYVAEPVGDGWEDFIAAEMETAVEQAGDKVLEEGVALVVTNEGKMLRRGVGKVPWRQMVNELEEAVTGEKKEGANPLLDFVD